MRKIILLCVLAIGMMADAQTVQTIAKPLKLSTVKAGTDNDDVLVRGADKLVKSVKRNKFVSSVNNFFPDEYGNVELNIPDPEAPTLQQVLDRSPYASGRLIGVEFGTFGTPSYENFYMGAPYGFYNTKGEYGKSSYRRVELSTNNGLYLKTTSLGNGFLKFKADNLENNDVVLQSPKRSGILPISVNGNVADEDGNITIQNGSTSEFKTINGNSIVGSGDIPINVFNGYSIVFDGDRAPYWYSGQFSLGNGNELTAWDATDSAIKWPQAPYGSPKTLALSVNDSYADNNGNISLSSITTTFTTNDGKTVTVTNGVITNIQ